MVEKEQKPADKPNGKASEKEQPKKEKETLPIDTDQMDENDIQDHLNDADEFEEFPIYTPPVGQTQVIDNIQEVNVWEDNWQDETVETDFAIQLSEELGNKDILKQIV